VLQSIKDFAISLGVEPWVRPVWNLLTGKKPDKYDIQLSAVIKKALPPNAVCVDIGCHKGLILDMLIRQCPAGTFYAFEPIPYLYNLLQRKYRHVPRVHVFDVALGSEIGSASFHINTTSPGLSGFHRRKLPDNSASLRTIEVRTDLLDNCLSGVVPNLIKIDVEGAEFRVLQGGRAVISSCRPLIVFEHGIGGADFYRTTPEDVFDLLDGCGMSVSTMVDFLADREPLGRDAFSRQYHERLNYYFIAHPITRS
jgi:FkbM family methyltransferase